MKRTLSAVFLSFVLFAPQVQAGMIATEKALPSDRARLNTLIERPEVAQQLEKMGISAEQAKERVAAMSEAGEMPAGLCTAAVNANACGSGSA